MSGISLAWRPSIRFGALCSEPGSMVCLNDRNAVKDLGQDPNAALGALLTDQVNGVHEILKHQVAMIQSADRIRIYRETTTATAVVWGEMDQDPVTDPWIKLDLRKRAQATIERGMRCNAVTGDHTHVSRIHPDRHAFCRVLRQRGVALRRVEFGHPERAAGFGDRKPDMGEQPPASRSTAAEIDQPPPFSCGRCNSVSWCS